MAHMTAQNKGRYNSVLTKLINVKEKLIIVLHFYLFWIQLNTIDTLLQYNEEEKIMHLKRLKNVVIHAFMVYKFIIVFNHYMFHLWLFTN